MVISKTSFGNRKYPAHVEAYLRSRHPSRYRSGSGSAKKKSEKKEAYDVKDASEFKKVQPKKGERLPRGWEKRAIEEKTASGGTIRRYYYYDTYTGKTYRWTQSGFVESSLSISPQARASLPRRTLVAGEVRSSRDAVGIGVVPKTTTSVTQVSGSGQVAGEAAPKTKTKVEYEDVGLIYRAPEPQVREPPVQKQAAAQPKGMTEKEAMRIVRNIYEKGDIGTKVAFSASTSLLSMQDPFGVFSGFQYASGDYEGFLRTKAKALMDLEAARGNALAVAGKAIGSPGGVAAMAWAGAYGSGYALGRLTLTHPVAVKTVSRVMTAGGVAMTAGEMGSSALERDWEAVAKKGIVAASLIPLYAPFKAGMEKGIAKAAQMKVFKSVNFAMLTKEEKKGEMVARLYKTLSVPERGKAAVSGRVITIQKGEKAMAFFRSLDKKTYAASQVASMELPKGKTLELARGVYLSGKQKGVFGSIAVSKEGKTVFGNRLFEKAVDIETRVGAALSSYSAKAGKRPITLKQKSANVLWNVLDRQKPRLVTAPSGAGGGGKGKQVTTAVEKSAGLIDRALSSVLTMPKAVPKTQKAIPSLTLPVSTPTKRRGITLTKEIDRSLERNLGRSGAGTVSRVKPLPGSKEKKSPITSLGSSRGPGFRNVERQLNVITSKVGDLTGSIPRQARGQLERAITKGIEETRTVTTPRGPGPHDMPPIPDEVPISKITLNFPKLRGFEFEPRAAKKGRRRKRTYRYAPSLTAVALNIRGAASTPKSGFAGVEIRPLKKGGKKSGKFSGIVRNNHKKSVGVRHGKKKKKTRKV